MSYVKNALIIGANSQDGKYLSKLLLEKNYDVYAIFNKNKFKIDKKLKKINLNLNNIIEIKNFLKKFNYLEIYYFPSINLNSNQKENYKIFIKNFDLNFIKLNNLLNSINDIKNKKKIKVFYSSSSHIFKGLETKKKQTEKSKYSTSTYYGFSKLCGLRLCEFYRDKFKLFVSIGILYTHFSRFSNKNFVIPKIYKQLKKKNTIKISDMNIKIDYLHANQVVKIIHKIMSLNKPNTFIISSGNKIKLKKICYIFSELIKKKKYQNYK